MITFCAKCGTRLVQRPFEGHQRPTCPACGVIAFADPKVAATVLIERDGAVLLVRRAVDPARGLWTLPGGYVDFGEDPLLAAARECQEEVGLAVQDLRLLDVSFNGRVIVITYRAASFSPAEPTPNDDADMAAWFSPADLPPLAFETVRWAVTAWQAQRNAPSPT